MNKRLANLEERKKALLAQSETILDASSNEDRDLTEAEQTTYDANAAELKTVAAGIQREHDLKSYLPTEPLINQFGPDHTPGQITNPKAAWEDDPKKEIGRASCRERV